jgi:hypothetical protein
MPSAIDRVIDDRQRKRDAAKRELEYLERSGSLRNYPALALFAEVFR